MNSANPVPPVEPNANRFMNGMKRAFVTAPVIIGAIVAWELFSPPAASLVVNGLEKLGMGSAASILAQKDAQAAYEHEVQMAISEVERLHDYYTRLAAAHTGLIQQAYQWEGQILQRQLNSVESSQTIGRLGANAADLGCFLGNVLGDPELKGACGVGKVMRDQMAGEMADVLENNRTIIPEQMMKGFPTPDKILSTSYQELAAKYHAKAQ